MARACELASSAGLMLAIGSSLEVYPVAGLPAETLAAGGQLALVTMGPTPYDAVAAVKLSGDVVDGALGGVGGARNCERIASRPSSTSAERSSGAVARLDCRDSTAYGRSALRRVLARPPACDAAPFDRSAGRVAPAGQRSSYAVHGSRASRFVADVEPPGGYRRSRSQPAASAAASQISAGAQSAASQPRPAAAEIARSQRLERAIAETTSTRRSSVPAVPKRPLRSRMCPESSSRRAARSPIVTHPASSASAADSAVSS